MKQSGFSDQEYQPKKKTTLKKVLVCDGQHSSLETVTQAYSKTLRGTGTGRRPISPGTMLRIYFMQQWYQLSDPVMEDSLYDIETCAASPK